MHRRINSDRYDQVKEVDRWYKDGGDKYFRYTYPLDNQSVVFDVGGYEGEWASGIYDRYRCSVYVFEPVKKYFDKISKSFKEDKKVKVFNVGLGGTKRQEKIFVDKFSSSIFKKGRRQETIEIDDIKKFCLKHRINRIDLIKINIEGGEYELLERIIGSGLINSIETLQIQFHNFVPNAERRMEKIQRELSRTHRPTYQYWFVWENWTKKGTVHDYS